MQVINRNALLWTYLSPEIKELIMDGEILLQFVKQDIVGKRISDYSFIVFPFAKAYEGFLKKFLLDSGLIHKEEYYSDDIRIGRILNPNFKKESSNIFIRICDHSKQGSKIAETLWKAWRGGRNQVFHFFPQNYKRLEYQEALDEVHEIVSAMEACIDHCEIKISSIA